MLFRDCYSPKGPKNIVKDEVQTPKHYQTRSIGM